MDTDESDVAGRPSSAPSSKPWHRPSAADAARIAVPTLLGLAGFSSVAGAVAATGGTMAVTLPALFTLAVLLAAAGTAPFLLHVMAGRPWWHPILAVLATALILLLLHLAAGHLVLFTLPAAPVALVGGALLLGTSLWGQFRKGPAPEPVIIPARELSSRPYGGTLLTVIVNWALFLAGGAATAWFLLNR